jgi:hypothetical protein
MKTSEQTSKDIKQTILKARWLSPEGMACRETLSQIYKELWESDAGQVARMRAFRLMNRRFLPITNYVEKDLRRICKG